MTTEPRTNLVHAAVGLCFVALGILLLLERSGVLDMRELVRMWPVALIIVGGAMAWQAARGGDVLQGGSVAGLVWVLIIGLVASSAYDRHTSVAEGNGAVRLFALMSGDRRPPIEGAFSGGTVTTVFGAATLDLRQAVVGPGQVVVVDVFTVFGGCEISVPPNWRVEMATTTILGGVEDERPRSSAGTEDAPATGAGPAPEPPRLVVRGTVFLGGVKVKT